MKRTALVTGGNRGIGREVCRQLAHRGLHVVLASRCQSDGEQAARELWSDCAADVVVVPLDVSDPASIAACTEELTGRDVQVDVLVNNAAICPEGRVLDLDHDTAEKALRTNLGGPFWLILAALDGGRRLRSNAAEASSKERPLGISTWHPRRRRDTSPRTIHAASRESYRSQS